MLINPENYKSQKKTILEHIKKYGNISTLEGYNKYKIMRVGSVINILRNEGYNIETIMEHNKRTNKRYARYYIKKEVASNTQPKETFDTSFKNETTTATKIIQQKRDFVNKEGD